MPELRIALDGNSIDMRTAMRHINHRARAPVESDAPSRALPPEEAIALLQERRDPDILSNAAFREWLLGERPGR
jgi:hypothetical protein